MNLKQFYSSCVRVFKITRKPDRKEFTDLVKITGLGLIVIGLMGFLVTVAFQFLVPL